MSTEAPNRTLKLAPFTIAIVALVLAIAKVWIGLHPDSPISKELSPVIQEIEKEFPEGSHPTFEQELDEAIGPPQEVSSGNVASGAQDLRHERVSAYDKARKEKLQTVHLCEACGRTKEQLAKIGAHLETHHVISVSRIFSESRDPELVADVNNLIVLCRGGSSKECHFRIGHDPDGDGPEKPSWSVSNPNVRRDAKKMLEKSK